MLRTLLIAGLATTALSAPVAAAQYEVVSQSVIVMRGIPARKKKAITAPVADAIEARAKVSAEGAVELTEEERRILRYGVEEESRDVAAEAERKIEEVDAAATMDEPETVKAEVAPEPEIDASNVTVSAGATAAGAQKPKPKVEWKSASTQTADKAEMQRYQARQNKAEAPQMKPSALKRMKNERPVGPSTNSTPGGNAELGLKS